MPEPGEPSQVERQHAAGGGSAPRCAPPARVAGERTLVDLDETLSVSPQPQSSRMIRNLHRSVRRDLVAGGEPYRVAAAGRLGRARALRLYNWSVPSAPAPRPAQPGGGAAEPARASEGRGEELHLDPATSPIRTLKAATEIAVLPHRS